MATAAVSSPIRTAYPIDLDVAPPAPQNRLSVLLRLIYVIPNAIVLSVLLMAFAVIWAISWIAILVTGSYPAALLKFSIGAWRWSMRLNGYAYLLTDKYPAFSLDDDADYPVRLLADEQVNGRNRLTTFWLLRAILAIPHLLVLGVLSYAAGAVAFIAWIIALVTGSVPAGLHNFLAGYFRWYARAYGYAFNLVDEYPPFSFN